MKMRQVSAANPTSNNEQPVDKTGISSARKPTVFRVTGLAATTTQADNDDVLDTALKAVIHNHLSDAEKRSGMIQVVTAILPSCYNAGERVALVEFRGGGVPAFLNELVVNNPLGEWQVELLDEQNTDISFDRHFFGFTQLYAPTPDVPVAAE